MKRTVKLTAAIIITALIFSMSCFCLQASGSRDVRGVWVATVANLDFPSAQGLSASALKDELAAIVDTCVKNGINTVFFQVRPTADALYRSDIFPWSRVLSGTQGTAPESGFDPLAHLLSLCKKNGLSLHAWINPYRVCKADELDTLSPTNPAVLHPEYTVTCSDGNVYFNPALKEVRQLITDGALEILERYDVDGIHFDDYFYPYSVTDYPDAADYEKYGGDFETVADFRRNNVDLLVEQVSRAVHKKDKVFGISPFGIWDNKRDNPDGSDTTGMSSYSQIYADSRHWVKKGWLDYICPQVYWSFENTAAPFETVTRWWSELCEKYDTDLYIGHAAYKLGESEAGWESALQLERQLELCAELDGVDGSVFFRYGSLRDNLLGCADVISGRPVELDVPDTPAATSSTLKITIPSNGYETTGDYCSVSGVTDPSLPLTVDGQSVTVTENGYFSVYKKLAVGKNTFTFSNGAQSRSITVIRTQPTSELPDCFYSGSSYPVGECWFSPSQTVTVEIDALPALEVHAVCAGTDIPLTETAVSEARARYSADITMPATLFADVSYGTVSFYAIKDGVRHDFADTASVTVCNTVKKLYTANDCYVYNSAFDGSMMDNYQLPAGSTVFATAFANGSYRLLSGKWVRKDNVSDKKAESDLDIDTDNYKKITLSSDTAFECYSSVSDSGALTLKLYGITNGEAEGDGCRYIEYPNYAVLAVKDVTGFYCHRISDKQLDIYVYYRRGVLDGKTVAIDPGHGGDDSGALGPAGADGATEAELNLSLSLMLANKLSSLGARVYLTRTDDSTVFLDERAGLIRRNTPDISISVHHNSLDIGSDFNAHSGPIVFYSRETSLSLAKSLAASLGCGTVKQSLNVCRDYRYPCVLLECGFVCNPAEYEKLLTDSYKTELCDKIVKSISDYFSKNS